MKPLYIRLAAVGVRKNGKSYIPYILTAAVMAAVFYIIAFLSNNPLLANMRGGEVMKSVLGVGVGVMAVFVAIFLFYTNSFLIKGRKKEFGLYNILGLKKSQIGHVLVCETLIVYAISVILGLGLGILFSKLAEELATKMLRGKIDYQFSVDVPAVIFTLIVFAVVFFVIMLNSLRQLFFSRPIELLRGGNKGEKPPRTNIPFAVVGLLLLGGAYYMAITIKNPGAAIMAFMIAVIMVIVATYLLFVAGSVALCKILQKNKNYYYKLKHFVSVSQMAYRMRKNGAGLASICILSTMTLVTISSTATLYFGVKEYVNTEHPNDIMITVGLPKLEYADLTERTVREVCEEKSITPENFSDQYQWEISGEPIGEALGKDPQEVYIRSCIYAADVFPETPVNSLSLNDGELAYSEPFSDYLSGRETLELCGKEFSLKKIDGGLKITDRLIYYRQSPDAPDPVIVFFAKDRNAIYELFGEYTEGTFNYDYKRTIGFDVPGADSETIDDLTYAIDVALNKYRGEEAQDGDENYLHTYISTKIDQLSRTYGVYGGLFFLGILLGGVFLLAAVLIMYYKQVTEGYEDAARFEILHKVGMSRREIKSSINSQVLTVFFLPLIAAGVHMGFAFPIISRMLSILLLKATWLFALVTVIVYLIFAAVYILVYRATSVSYSRIVNK